jgi:protein-tyrosine phosphatase
MDFIRELVSMKKTRYTEQDFNLDLTYITPRIIAMAFPAEGLESMIRNKISDVARLLNIKHENHYLIINASNRSYDFEKFNHSVYSIPWPNHYPCPLDTFASSIADVALYLVQNEKNVIVVHCLAGKGRTGSLIDAILFTSGLYSSIEEANDFYLKQRAVNVTYSSQLRYLKYFETMYSEGVKNMNFKGKVIKSIVIESKMKGFFLDKFFKLEVFDFAKDDELLAEMIIDGNSCQTFNQIKEDDGKNSDNMYPKIFFCKSKPKAWANNEAADILMILKIPGLVKSTKLFRINFNMHMTGNYLTLEVKDLDKANNLPDDFKLRVQLMDIDDSELEYQNHKRFNEINHRLQIIRDLKNENNFGLNMLYGQEEPKQFSKESQQISAQSDFR